MINEEIKTWWVSDLSESFKANNTFKIHVFPPSLLYLSWILKGAYDDGLEYTVGVLNLNWDEFQLHSNHTAQINADHMKVAELHQTIFFFFNLLYICLCVCVYIYRERYFITTYLLQFLDTKPLDLCK